jgi:hypothetical protein
MQKEDIFRVFSRREMLENAQSIERDFISRELYDLANAVSSASDVTVPDLMARFSAIRSYFARHAEDVERKRQFESEGKI